MDELKQEMMERISRMDLRQVSHKEISQILSLSESRLSQIMVTDDYKEVLAANAGADFEKIQTLNDGWDMLESISLNALVDVIENTPEPELLLRAAGIANKAHRRGQFHDTAITPKEILLLSLICVKTSWSLSTINLSWLAKLKTLLNIQQKRDDFLPQSGVEALMETRETKEMKGLIFNKQKEPEHA